MVSMSFLPWKSHVCIRKGVSSSTMSFTLTVKLVQMFFAIPTYTQKDKRVSLTYLSKQNKETWLIESDKCNKLTAMSMIESNQVLRKEIQ